MHFTTSTIAIAFTFLVAAPEAVAQEYDSISTCQSFGSGPSESIGDRDGHSLSFGEVSCHVDTGPLAGGIITSYDVWEWDGQNAKQLSNTTITRKPGAFAVAHESDVKFSLTMADGKITGWTSSGHMTYIWATGTASALVGKSFTITAKPISSGQFTLEAKADQ
jgi:hypothetical protein